MKKDSKKNLMRVLGIILFVILVGTCIWFLNRERIVTDAKKFKAEYEKLNGTVRESDGQKYGTITIDENNPIKYIDVKDAIEVLDSKQAIMYIGAPWCPWCRNAIPVLFEVAKKYDINTIYYVELDDVKSSFEIVDGHLKKTREGTKEYYALLDKLKSRLNEYVLQEGKNIYHTGEKRIYMPYVLSIKDGKVVGDKVGTVSLDEGQSKYEELTEKQSLQLYKEYEELFRLAYENDLPECGGDVCD